MKSLFVLVAIAMTFGQANAVTSSKKSTKAVSETQSRDVQLYKQLAQEVESEEAAKNANKAPAPKAVITPSQEEVSAAAGKELSSEDAAMANEMAAAEAIAVQTKLKEYTKQDDKKMYVSAVIGTGAYPDVNNVAGSYSAAVALGYTMDRMIMFEGGIGLTRYQLDVKNQAILNKRDNFDIDQYVAFMGAKYRILEGRVVPTVGGILAYTQRNFTLTNPYNATLIPGTNSTVNAGSSQTTDFGLTAGVDFEFNRDFAVGVDVKYMINLANKTNQDSNNMNSTSFNGYAGTSIERLQHYTAGVSARMNF